MLIGLDGIPLNFPKTGVGHYTAQLASALAQVAPEHEFRLVYPSFYSPENFQSDLSAPSNLTSDRVRIGRVKKLWWSVGLPLYLRRQHVQLFHGTNYDIPLWRQCPTVLSIYDLSALLYPQTHEKKRVRRARRRLPLMSKTADAIIVPTEPIREEVCEHLNVPERKVFVVPGAARNVFKPVAPAISQETRKKFGIGEQFVLAVGTIEPRKNLPTLVDAFEKLSLEKNLQLVIAGGKGWLGAESFRAIENSLSRNRIVLTDYLPDEDLCALYSSCSIFVYPSIYEGYGLPPIEAMACGAPVVVSNIPVLVESTGGAARVAAPHDANDLAQVMLEVITSEEERQRLSTLGKRRAAELTWEDAARKTLAVYETVIG